MENKKLIKAEEILKVLEECNHSEKKAILKVVTTIIEEENTIL